MVDTKMWLKCPQDVKTTQLWSLKDFFSPLILTAHFVCSHMGDVLRVPAVFAGCWAEWMATSSIDLQCGQQIKPQDKRLGRRTMEEHSGPHGKRMTTGRSGRPQPTTAALVPGRNGPHNVRQEKVSESGTAKQRDCPVWRVRPWENYPQEHRLAFYLFIPILFISSLPQYFSSSFPVFPSAPILDGHRPWRK